MPISRRATHTEGFWANNTDPTVMRCTGHFKSTGARCSREAEPGTNVCRNHGALIPAVQAAAAVRINSHVDEMVIRLKAMLDDPLVKDETKVRIIHDWLDRGGFATTNKHVIGVVGSNDPLETFFRDLLATPGVLVDPATQPPPPKATDPIHAAELAARAEPEILDAEIVEEPQIERCDDQPPPHILAALKSVL